MVRIVLIFVPTFSLVFFHCQHPIVWEHLKPLKLKEEPNPVLSSLGQKLLHSRDESIFGLYHLHKPCVKIFRPNSRDTSGQRYQFSEVLSKMPKDSKEKHSLNIPILILSSSDYQNVGILSICTKLPLQGIRLSGCVLDKMPHFKLQSTSLDITQI